MGYCLHAYAIRFDKLFEAQTEHLDGYELKALVERLGGRFQSNMYWSAMRMMWFDMVDEALASAQSDVKLSEYFNDPPPIPHVSPVDFPMIGHIKPEAASPLAVALRAVQLQGQEAEAVAEVLEWLDDLSPNEGIVTFYH